MEKTLLEIRSEANTITTSTNEACSIVANLVGRMHAQRLAALETREPEIRRDSVLLL